MSINQDFGVLAGANIPASIASAGASVTCNSDGSVTFTPVTVNPGGNSKQALFYQAVASHPLAHVGFGDISFQRTTDMSESTTGAAGLWTIRYGNPATSTAARITGADFTGAVPTGNTANFTAVLGGITGLAVGAVQGGTGTVTHMIGIGTDLWTAVGSTVTNLVRIMDIGQSLIAGTVTNYYGIYINTMTVGANNYGLFIANCSPGFSIYVAAGNSRFEGQVGIQNNGVNAIALLGIGSNVNFAGSAATAEGINVQLTGSAAATTNIIAASFKASTQATAFTCASLIGAFVDVNVKGAGSTVTTCYGVYISAQNAGSTNWDLYVLGSNIRLSSGVANSNVATVLGSLGPAGSHTTVQEWLQISTQNGVRYIPCF